MKRKRVKIIAASALLLTAMAFLVIAGIRSTSVRHFTPAGLVAAAKTLNNQRVQVDGLILQGSSSWDAANFALTFAVRDREGSESVNVLYANRLKPDNFVDGGSVFVEGRYDAAQNLIVATKLMTKCASKYEEADSATPANKSSYLSN